VPTRWLLSGKTIAIAGAPTRWGPAGFSLRMTSPSRIEGEVSLPAKAPPETLLRIRLAAGKQIRAAWVDGKPVTHTSSNDVMLIEAGPRTRKISVEIG
jgi:hypothetical protein